MNVASKMVSISTNVNFQNMERVPHTIDSYGRNEDGKEKRVYTFETFEDAEYFRELVH